MKWLYLALAIVVFTYFFRSISISLLLLHSKRCSAYPKWINLLLIWLLPYYWASKVKEEIQKQEEVETYYHLKGDDAIDAFDLFD